MNPKVETGAILYDLEISQEDMFSDPWAFAKRVLDKGKELETIVKQDTSVSALANEVKKNSVNVDLRSDIGEILENLYHLGDDMELPELTKYIDAVSGLAQDLKNTFRDRTLREATYASSTVHDKRFAHLMYIRLRKAYESYRQLMKLFNADVILPLMPALPGNYGGAMASNLKYWMFTIAGEKEGYFNHRQVAKKLGLPEHFNTLRDFIEWVDSDNNRDQDGNRLVEAREVTP